MIKLINEHNYNIIKTKKLLHSSTRKNTLAVYVDMLRNIFYTQNSFTQPINNPQHNVDQHFLVAVIHFFIVLVVEITRLILREKIKWIRVDRLGDPLLNFGSACNYRCYGELFPKVDQRIGLFRIFKKFRQKKNE